MSEAKNDGSSDHENPHNREGESSDFFAPLGTAKSGRLVFASRASRVRLKGSRMVDELYKARFEGDVPRLWLCEGTLTIQYPRSPYTDQPAYSQELSAEIILNDSIPWGIEFREGVSKLEADLGRLQLRSLDILGGARQIELALSKPTGTTFIYISGGICESTIRRPPGVGVRIRVSGGVSKLALDGQHLGAAGGDTSLVSPDFESTTGRYDICIAGGASQVTID